MRLSKGLITWVLLAAVLLPICANASETLDFTETGWNGNMSETNGHITGSLEKYFPD